MLGLLVTVSPAATNRKLASMGSTDAAPKWHNITKKATAV